MEQKRQARSIRYLELAPSRSIVAELGVLGFDPPIRIGYESAVRNAS